MTLCEENMIIAQIAQDREESLHDLVEKIRTDGKIRVLNHTICLCNTGKTTERKQN